MFSEHDPSIFWDEFDRLLTAQNYAHAYNLFKISLLSPSRTLNLGYFVGEQELQSSRALRMKALLEWKSRVLLGGFETAVAQYAASKAQHQVSWNKHITELDTTLGRENWTAPHTLFQKLREIKIIDVAFSHLGPAIDHVLLSESPETLAQTVPLSPDLRTEWKRKIEAHYYTVSVDQQAARQHNNIFRTEALDLYKTLIRTHYETDIQRQALFPCFVFAAEQLIKYYRLLREVDQKHPELSEGLSNHNSTQSMECLELIYGAYALAYSAATEEQKRHIEHQRKRFIADTIYHHAELFWKDGLDKALRSKDIAKFVEWLNGLCVVTDQLKGAGYLEDAGTEELQLTHIFRDEFSSHIMEVCSEWHPFFLEKFHRYLGSASAPSPEKNERYQLLEARQLFNGITSDIIAEIQYDFSEAVGNLLRNILIRYVEILGLPPRNFGFFILGSLSTYKALPGSDVEYLLLIEDNKQHLDTDMQRYFDSLWTLFAIHVCEIGEVDGFHLDGLAENHAGTHMRGITTARLQYLLDHTEQEYDEGLLIRDQLATSFLSARCLVEFSTSTLEPQKSSHIETLHATICQQHESAIYTGPTLNNNRLPLNMTNGQARVIARLVHAMDTLLGELNAGTLNIGLDRSQGTWRYSEGNPSLELKKQGTQPLLVILHLLAVYRNGAFTSEMRSLGNLLQEAFPSNHSRSYTSDIGYLINVLHYLRSQNHLEKHFKDEIYKFDEKSGLLSSEGWNIFYIHVITPLYIAIKGWLEDPSKDFPAVPPMDNILKLNKESEESDIHARMKTAAFTWVKRYLQDTSALTEHFNILASQYWDTLSQPLRRIFYQELIQLDLPSVFQATQQQLAWLLAHRPQADGWRLQTELDQLNWDAAVEVLFEPEEPSDVALSNNGDMVYLQLIVTTPDTEKLVTRALKVSAINQLFSGPGVLKDPTPDFVGRHRVLAIEQNGYFFGVKFDPEHPSAEVATYYLNQRINGQGVPIGSVGHLHYKTPAGMKSVPIYLMPNVRKSKPFSYAARRLTDELQGWAAHINPISYAQHFFRVLILGASDDRPTDYFLYPSQQEPGTYDLVRLDNERMLDQSTYERSLLGTIGSMFSQGRLIGAGTGVQIGSILFCMSHLYEPLSNEVLEEIASLDIQELLKAWARELNLHTISLHEMFPDLTAKDYFNRAHQSTYAALYLPEDQVRKLVMRLEDIQTQIHRYFLSRQVANADGVSFEPLRAVDIFRQVYPEIALFYENTFVQHPPSPEDKGDLAHKRFSGLNKDHDFYVTTAHQGQVSTQASLALVDSHSRALGRKIRWEDIEYVRRGRKNSVKNVLTIVESFDPIAVQGVWDRIIEHAEKGNQPALKQAISDFRKLTGSRKKLDLIWRFTKTGHTSPTVQKAILEAMQGLPWVHFKGNSFAPALAAASLYPVLVQAKDRSNRSTLVKLEIENADNLMGLDLLTLPGTLFETFVFSSLRVLIVKNCKNLGSIRLYAPLLEELVLVNCPSLTVVEVNSTAIKNGEITGCDKINKNSLSILVKQKFEPAEMMMRRLYPVHIAIGSMDFSSRVVSRREIEPSKIEEKPPSGLLIKTFLLGDPAVGKSVLLEKYTEGKFNPSSNVTIGILYKEIVLNDVNYSEDPDDRSSNFDCRLQVFDGGGQERFQSLLMAYYRGVGCFIICYDTTIKKSFENLSHWVRQAKGFNSNKYAKFLIVGTKADIKEYRQVDKKEAEKVSKELGAFAYIECSSKYNVNLNEVFLAAARAGMVAHMDEMKGTSSVQLVTIPKKKIPLADRKSPNRLLLKVVMAGGAGVGRTTLSESYVERKFVQTWGFTIGFDFKRKDMDRIRHPEGDKKQDIYDCSLQIWDINGNEELSSKGTTRVLFADVDCVLLCYDKTQRRTFQRMKAWYADSKSKIKHPVRYIVIETKADLKMRAVTSEEAKAYAKEIGAVAFFECSAKNYTNIDEVFLAATHAAIDACTDKFNDGIPVKKLEPEKPKPTLSLAPRVVNQVVNRVNDERNLFLKIIMLGHTYGGQTSLIDRYVNGTFKYTGHGTVGCDFSAKTVLIGDYTCKLQIWDIAGHERFDSLSHNFYREALCCIFSFDITNRESFRLLDFWVQNFKKNGNKAAKYIVVAKKIDLISERVVSYEEGKSYAESIGAVAYFECSAKEGTNVEQAFLAAAHVAMEVHQAIAPQPNAGLLEAPR